MVVEIGKLAEQIQMMRNELLLTAETAGINSQDTLRCSQKLDQLIIAYQKNVGRCYQK